MNILNNAKDALVEKDIKNRHIFIDLYKKNDKTYILSIGCITNIALAIKRTHQ